MKRRRVQQSDKFYRSMLKENKVSNLEFNRIAFSLGKKGGKK